MMYPKPQKNKKHDRMQSKNRAKLLSQLAEELQDTGVYGCEVCHLEHEPVIYCSSGKDQPPFYGDRTDKTVIQTLDYKDFDKLTKDGLVAILQALKSRSTIFYETQRGQEYVHPTQKPIGAVVPFIKNSSRPDDVVVDIFCGSGTTLMAAHQLDRQARCMEFSPGFCDVIRRRYAKMVGEQNQWMELTKAID